MNKITKTTLTVSALALGLIAPLGVYAQQTTPSSIAQGTGAGGIASTRHNLSTGSKAFGSGASQGSGSTWSGGTSISGTNTDEICVFCHTPHAANMTYVDPITKAVRAPLWNRAIKPDTTYTPYTSGSMQGTAGVAPGSPSLACLSCHDGTQAMDSMINKPGSSGYDINGSVPTGSSIGQMASASGSFIANLGTDLSNDHPIGVAYCGGGQQSSGSMLGCADQDFFGATQDSTNASNIYVATSSTDPVRTRLRLYGTSVGSATVECGSCHDPHNAQNKTFLRIPNSGSAVCLTCHAK